MREGTISPLVAGIAALIAIGLVGSLIAQGRPADLIASGTPEHTLSGINVYVTRIADARKRLGIPTRVVDYPERDRRVCESCGFRKYWWETSALRLSAAAGFHTENGRRIESMLYAVEVWGTRPSKNGVGLTGAGLGLGDSITSVRRFYGDRMSIARSMIIVEWKDGTELTVDADQTGQITHMQLIAGNGG